MYRGEEKMKVMDGVMNLILLVIVSYIVVGFYTLLPYWLVTSAIASSGVISTMVYSFILVLWLYMTVASIGSMGKVGNKSK